MTALSDALAAAQSRAVAALGKQYVGGQLDGDAVRIALDGIGLADPTDTEHWIAALDIIRETGATAPAETKLPPEVENGKQPASEAQLTLIKRLADDKKAVAPNRALTKVEAHMVIDSLKNGSYDPDKWTVPF